MWLWRKFFSNRSKKMNITFNHTPVMCSEILKDILLKYIRNIYIILIVSYKWKKNGRQNM